MCSIFELNTFWVLFVFGVIKNKQKTKTLLLRPIKIINQGHIFVHEDSFQHSSQKFCSDHSQKTICRDLHTEQT